MPDSDVVVPSARVLGERRTEPHLRPAEPADAQFLYEMSRPDMPAALVPRDRCFYDDRIGEFWVCVVDGALAGCVGVRRLGELAELYNVCVHAAWRGRGVGRLLTASAVLLLALDGVREVVLFTRARAGWFADLGFEAAAESVLPRTRRDLIDRRRGSRLMRRATWPDHSLVAALDGDWTLAGALP